MGEIYVGWWGGLCVVGKTNFAFHCVVVRRHIM